MGDLELCYLSAVDAIRLFKSRELSPVEYTKAYIARAERLEPVINAFADTYFDEALQQSKVAEDAYMRPGDNELRPLEGVLVAVKDAQRIAGKRTSYGSLIMANNIDEISDPMIERLQDAGAIIHARTTTPEFCLSTSCESRMWGVTRNPFNLAYGPGGSSGGSGASLAAGTTTIATGTDIGGSIRIPASCCGLVGYKPPKGRNPDGAPASFDPYNHCGPMTRSVGDAALFQNIVSGQYNRDHHSLREKVHIPYVASSIGDLRIAWSMDLGHRVVNEDVRRNTLTALDVFRSLGCRVEEVDINWTADCDQAAQAWYNAMHFGRQTYWFSKDHADLMTDYALAAAEAAGRISPDAVAKSWEMQHQMAQDFADVMEHYDLLICPTTSIAALPVGQDMLANDFEIEGRVVDPEYGWILAHHFNMLHNCPVMSVPSGRSVSGVPTGIQLVGAPFDDLTVFRAAFAYENAVGGWFKPDQRPELMEAL